MKWLDSNTIKTVGVIWLADVLAQSFPLVRDHKLDWWTVGTVSATSLAGIVYRMQKPDVVAPKALDAVSLGFLNRNNPMKP